MAVSAEHCTAPTAVMRFGLVAEPEDAGLVFAALHETEVARRQQGSSSFGYGCQNGGARVLSSHSVNRQRALLAPHQSGMALRLGEKTVEDRRISSLSALPFFYQRPDVLPQGSTIVPPGRTSRHGLRWRGCRG